MEQTARSINKYERKGERGTIQSMSINIPSFLIRLYFLSMFTHFTYSKSKACYNVFNLISCFSSIFLFHTYCHKFRSLKISCFSSLFENGAGKMDFFRFFFRKVIEMGMARMIKEHSEIAFWVARLTIRCGSNRGLNRCLRLNSCGTSVLSLGYGENRIPKFYFSLSIRIDHYQTSQQYETTLMTCHMRISTVPNYSQRASL